jgi:hypothetical protein
MRFVIVLPAIKRFITFDGDLNDAVISAGLSPGAIDHGTLRPGLGYVVGEYAMFEPTDQQHYFGFGTPLIAGNAVLYSYDSEGQTIDFIPSNLRELRWFDFIAEIERDIARDWIKRPVMSLPDQSVFWQWPQPKPDLQEWSRRLGVLLAAGHPIQIDDTIIVPVDKGDAP